MENNKEKNNKLALSILIDILGLVSYFYPGLGESIDLVWAPISGALILAMYKDYKGRVPAALGGFLEEIIPFSDAIPSATLMWFYTFVINKNKNRRITD